MSEAGTRPSYTPGLINAIRKAIGKAQAGLDEEDLPHILQSIGYEGRLYIRFITHEDARAYRHNMHGKIPVHRGQENSGGGLGRERLHGT